MRKMVRLAAAGLLLGLALGGAAEAAEVAKAPQEVRPLLIGAKVPDAELRKADGAKVGFGELLEKQPTIVILYRGGW